MPFFSEVSMERRRKDEGRNPLTWGTTLHILVLVEETLVDEGLFPMKSYNQKEGGEGW